MERLRLLRANSRISKELYSAKYSLQLLARGIVLYNDTFIFVCEDERSRNTIEIYFSTVIGSNPYFYNPRNYLRLSATQRRLICILY